LKYRETKNSSTEITRSLKLALDIIFIKNRVKRQVLAGSGKLVIIIYYVNKIKNNQL